MEQPAWRRANCCNNPEGLFSVSFAVKYLLFQYFSLLLHCKFDLDVANIVNIIDISLILLIYCNYINNN